MRLFKNWSPREESMFLMVKVSISLAAYDVECNMEMRSPVSTGVLGVPSLARFPVVFQDAVFEPERRLKQKGIPDPKDGSRQMWAAFWGGSLATLGLWREKGQAPVFSGRVEYHHFLPTCKMYLSSGHFSHKLFLACLCLVLATFILQINSAYHPWYQRDVSHF